MKKLFFGTLFTVCFFVANAQTKVAAPTQPVVASAATNTTVSFDKTKFNFGKIKQGVPKGTSFTVKNNGTKPLIIEQATAQCGCTTPEYSKAPILKGKSTSIKVTYNAATPGPFTKTVTVKFLGIAVPTTLTIDGEVLKADAPAPANKG